jgi:hypothetical protein
MNYRKGIKMQQNKKYLTQKQACEILGIKITTMNHLRAIKSPRIKGLVYIKIGRIILFPEDEFHSFLASNMKTI